MKHGLIWIALTSALALGCVNNAPTTVGDAGTMSANDDASAEERDAALGIVHTEDASPDATADTDVVIDRPVESDVEAPTSRCGDGVQQAAEQCDDGNTVDDDGCNNRCELLRFDPPEMNSVATGILNPSTVCRPTAMRAGARAAPPVDVRYRIHQCRGSDGTFPVSIDNIRAAMSDVRDVYAAFGVRLIEESVREFTENDCVITHGDSAFEARIEGATPANLIPIVFVRRIVSGAAFPVGGFASFQGIVVNAGSAHEVVAHELGHFFGLAHTHACNHGVETAGNCATAGDFFCDTPADRGPAGVSGLDTCLGGTVLNGSCTNVACASASCADASHPDPRNVMSYYHCWPPRVSDEQQDFIRCTLRNELLRFTAPPCVDECPSRDTRECVGAGSVRVCGNTDADACLEWSPPTDCAASERCVGGNCASTCTPGMACNTGNPCETGAVQCVGGAPRCERSGVVAAGTACGSGRVCGDGTCACPAGTEACSGVCVDVTSSPDHCGGCSPCARPEGGSAVCRSGVCAMVCSAPRALCGSRCIDTTTDTDNCGACGLRCTAPVGGSATCSAGRCVPSCPARQSNCGGFCRATGGACPNPNTACGGGVGVVTCAGSTTTCTLPRDRTFGTCGCAGPLCTCNTAGRCVDAYVELCTDVNYTGPSGDTCGGGSRGCLRLPVVGGSLRVPNLGSLCSYNDQVSSVRLVNVRSVTLFWDNTYSGASVTLTASCPDLHGRNGVTCGIIPGTRTDIGDQTTSVIITP